MGVAVSGKSVETLRDIARQVYKSHKNVTEVAARAFIDRVVDADKLDDLTLWAAFEHLHKERLTANKRVYEQAHKLRERLTVEAPPPGFKAPNEPVVSAPIPAKLTSVRGSVGRGGMAIVSVASIASMRVLLELKVRIGDGKVIQPHSATRPEVFKAADQLESQGQGCLRNGAALRELGKQMLPGERGIDTVRRLEAERA